MDGSFVLELPELPSSFRRFHPDDVHLTLAFLGDCDEDHAMRAVAALDERLKTATVGPMKVSLGEVVPMGARGRRYTALSALLGEGRDEATACVASLRDVLADAAERPRDQRPAKPHVTLARPRGRATDADRRAGLAWAASLDLGRVHATLDRIALYTWNEIRRERLFRIVVERRLG